MIAKVVQVKPTSDFKVFIYFDDGKIKLFDMNPYLGKGVFQQISSLHDFTYKCTVLNGTLAWDLSGMFDPTHCHESPQKLKSNQFNFSVKIEPLSLVSSRW